MKKWMNNKSLVVVSSLLVVVLMLTIGFVVAKKSTKSEKMPENQEEEQTKDGMQKSLLTGEWVDEDIAKTRAVAVMTENTKESLPQYGICSAGVLYEAPVEGGITRMMAIYEDYKDLTQIGNVRSCRPYYAYFAREFDAVYVHFGQSIHAEELLNSGFVNNLSGLDGSVNDTFYRTDEHPAPHNAYTSAEGIAYGIETKGYRTGYDSDFEGHYVFAKDDKENKLKDGDDCVEIKPYYFYNKPSFVYDKKTKTYKRYQFGEPQVDAVDGKQVEVTNIIFQNVASSIYENTAYLNLTVDGSGEGKFFTRGKMTDITWTKEADGITHYYDSEGKEIVLNQGKTWVCIIEKQYAEKNEFAATEE